MDKFLSTTYGLSLDQIFYQRKPGTLSYALNANLQSKDGRGITYTNETSNQLCVNFPEGFVVVGVKAVLAKNEIIFALVNPETQESEIGKVTNYNCNSLTNANVEYNCTTCKHKFLESAVEQLSACCNYSRIIRSSCLNFKQDWPVRMIYKITNCDYKLYFTDGLNEPRYIDFADFTNGTYTGTDSCGDAQEFDCDRIKIFKDFCIPSVTPHSVESGGSLQAGVYQASVVYTDQYGREYTDYFGHTNPVPIFDRALTNETDYFTNKAIKFKITHPSDVFEYFKLVIIKTVDGTSQYLEEGVHKVQPVNYVTYTGNKLSPVIISLEKISKLQPNYTSAKLIEESADHLILADLEADPDYNLQPFANQLRLHWETVEMPYDSDNNYSNPIIAASFRTYQRDEVYPFGIVFKFKNGKKSKAYHIPNRELTSFDRQFISKNHKDNIQEVGCDEPVDKQRWQVYNTASKTGNTPTPSTNQTFADDKICDIVRHKYGEFAAWESTETYPCDKDIWGDLAGKPIRYHKFPDSLITHIHDSFGTNSTDELDINHKSKLYPIGVRLDEDWFNTLSSDFKIFNPKTGQNDIDFRELICGFELVRGNRVGQKSIVAKGLMYDIGKVTERDGGTNLRSYYFPNYPYNDITEDKFLSADRTIYNTSDPNSESESDKRLHAYQGSEFRRFTFHSPDTHFQKPQLGTYLKLETEEFGVQEGHFVPVSDHPRYKFLTKMDSYLATALGLAAAINVTNEASFTASIPPAATNGTKIDFNYSDLINTSDLVRDTIEKLIPRRNFAYAYHSRGVYNNYSVIPNDELDPTDGLRGRKIRSLEIAKYASSNNQNLGDDASVHNYGRESSVYLKTTSKFQPYRRGENSRYTLGNNPLDSQWCKHPEQIKPTGIRSFYASVKRFIPDQYGNIDNLVYVPTGYCITFDNGVYEQTYYPAFGGDTFISRFSLKRKMPFFTQNMVGRPDEVDFDYDLVPNIAFPTYYIGTSPDELKLSEIISTGDIAALTAGLIAAAAGGLLPYIPGVTPALNATALIGISGAGVSIYTKLLSGFLPKNNLDCDTTPSGVSDFSVANVPGYTLFYQSGKFYLASYGIPTFFVESDVNVELRHGRNETDENFYPNVGNGIPDEWLQEKTVPILRDNKYNYNDTYSVQNYQQYIQPFNNYKFDKLCQASFPNRVIYSEKSNLEENFDNWLKFAYNNYYDFDKSNGKIVGIHGLDNNRLLVRFENSFQVWNTRITLPSSSPLDVSLSNSGMFTQDPLEYSKTNVGYGGSQHIAFESTKVGSFWVDAARGTIFRFTTNLEEISATNYNWFKENLPFKILKNFPTYNIDNSFKDIGIAICWDDRFKRLIVTKKDYEVRPDKVGQVVLTTVGDTSAFVRYDLDLVIPISVDDPDYFINRSFTIAWSPDINNWVSFYSYLPNYYVSHPTHFQSGLRNSLWNHGLSNLSYQTFYNTFHPYILELPVSNIPKAEILKSVTVNTDILKYTSETDFYSLKSINKDNYNIFFTNAIVYNKEQCTGMLNLVETPINNLRDRMSYPRNNADSIDILYGKKDKVCTFNTLYDSVANHSFGQPLFTDEWDSIKTQYPIDKVLNPDAYSYSRNIKKVPIKSSECYVRLIQDEHSRYKFVNNFEIFQQENKNQ